MATPAYRRIHVEDPAEFPLIYRLLVSYITDPELASMLKEVVFRPADFSTYCYCKSCQNPTTDEWIATEATRDISEEHIIRRGVKSLALSAKDEEEWVRNLTWMKPDLVERRTISMEGAGVEYGFRKFAEKQNHLFAYQATALLLMVCPNIERLVYADEMPKNQLKEILRKNNYGTLPEKHLQNLRDVVLLSTSNYMYDDERFYIPMDTLDLLRMFHRLPSIESVSAEAVDGLRDSFEDNFPPGTSNIKNISFTHSAFGSQVVPALIRAPKALESLKITTGGRASRDGCSNVVYAKEIGKALGCHRATLVKLDLDLGFALEASRYDCPEDALRLPGESHTEERQEDEWQVLRSRESTTDEMEAQGPWRAMKLHDDRSYGMFEETIGPLHDFDRLTHLSIAINLLHNSDVWLPDEPIGSPVKLVDALPPNLEYLLVRGYTKGNLPDLDDQFAELLEQKSARFPKLKQIYGVESPIPEGRTVEYPDEEPELLWKVEHTDQGWREYTSDEL